MWPLRSCLRVAFPVAALAWMPSPAQAADPQPYAVSIAKTGNGPLDGALGDSSNLQSLRTSSPVAPFGLVTRAQSDVDRLQTALRSFGYYAGHVAVTIDGKPLDDPGLPDALAASPPKTEAKVAVAVETGPLFHLRHVTVEGDVPAGARGKLGVVPGAPAIASDVLAGQARLLTALQTTGHALAKVDIPDAVEDPAAQVLDVTYHAAAGPRVDVGVIAVDGLQTTNDSYVRRRLLLHSGEQYNPDTIEKARQDLAATGIFGSVQANAAPALSPDGTIPITFKMVERPRHAISFNGNYSTDLGLSGGATLAYRNVFGNAETLTFNALSNAGGSSTRGAGYVVSLGLVQPDWQRRDQALSYNLAYIRENLEAYNRKAIAASVALTRKLTDQISASVGVSAEQERVTQEAVTRNYTPVGLPLGLTYDTTGPDGLFNPTHGVKAGVTVTPTYSLETPSAFFTLITVRASTYINLASEEGRSVIALRGLVGTAQGASTFLLPPDQRFYAGGSATVRGYKYQAVGPQFPVDHYPIGGVSVDAATIEYRQRIGESFGAAVFVDSGQVGTQSAPFNGTLFTGVGAGGRYYTALGPLRVDIAVPLMKRRKDSSLEVYIGLGQAF
jgi:translocation and assembly module TamA